MRRTTLFLFMWGLVASAQAPAPLAATRLQSEKALYYYCARASAILHFEIKPARQPLPAYCHETQSYSHRPACILVKRAQCLKGKCPVHWRAGADPRKLKFEPPETWTFGYQVAGEQLYALWMPNEARPRLTTAIGPPVDRIAFREHCLNPRALASP